VEFYFVVSGVVMWLRDVYIRYIGLVALRG